MNLRILKHSWLLLLVATATACFAQTGGTEPRVVPEAVMAARLSNSVAPKLPHGALSKRCSNMLVTLKITIDENGKVRNSEFLSGYADLRDPSITAVKQWIYKPYQEQGQPIAVQTRVSIFYLGDGESFPMYSPDGKGGVKGGDVLPLPAGCGPGPHITRVPS